VPLPVPSRDDWRLSHGSAILPGMSAKPAGDRSTSALGALGLVLAMAALVGVTVWSQLFPPGSRLLHKAAPDFALPIVANGDPGARLRLSDLAGLVLDFWASWCEPCAMQAPILERFARSHPGEVVVVGINLDDEPGVVQQYARQKALSYPIVSDEQGEARSAYDAQSLPSVVVVDARGTVTRYLRGLVSRADLDAALRLARKSGG
jgi:cytochrome c biogenesis protein CcmG/thiol:disulfide interchange protein DsbE